MPKPAMTEYKWPSPPMDASETVQAVYRGEWVSEIFYKLTPYDVGQLKRGAKRGEIMYMPNTIGNTWGWMGLPAAPPKS